MATTLKTNDQTRLQYALAEKEAGDRAWDILRGAATHVIRDDILLTFGTDDDIALVNRSTTLAANTALTGVLDGTPVTPALAANSLIISNTTASGDILIAADNGGNSQAWIWVDSSAGTMGLYGAGTAVAILSATAFEIEDGILLALGNDQDVVLLNRATTLAANTALTGVLIGTPVTPAVAANSLILANATASGDILIAGNLGGASRAYVFADVSADTLDLLTAGVSRLLLGAAGALFINDTADAGITIGLCVNQGANDDIILSFKSSDVAHGTTTLVETDTYAFARKAAAADGGLELVGISDVTTAVILRGVSVTESVTDPPTTTSLQTCIVRGGVKSGTTTANIGATGNLFCAQNDDATNEFVVKGDGELYSNQSATVGTFDAYNDALMCQDLSNVLSREYGKVMEHNRDLFERLGILGPLDEKGQGMYSLTKTVMLTLCAIGQLGKVVNEMAAKLGVSAAGILGLTEKK